MPTAPVTIFSNIRVDPYMDADDALAFHVTLATGSYAAGTLIAEATASLGTFRAHNSAGADGTEVAKAILPYAVTVDASGNHSHGGDIAATTTSVEAYFSGTFLCSELVGLLPATLTKGNGWRLINGDVTTGVIRLG